jgi:hypothetical protein
VFAKFVDLNLAENRKMADLTNIFQPIVALQYMTDNGPKQKHFSVGDITRISARFSNAAIEDKRAAGSMCSEIYHTYSNNGIAVIETPAEVIEKIAASEDALIARMQKSRLSVSPNIFNPFVTFHRKDGENLLQRCYNIAQVYRCEAKYTDDKIDEKRAAGFSCTELYFGKGSSLTIVETPMEVKQSIEAAQDEVFSRMQKARLTIV